MEPFKVGDRVRLTQDYRGVKKGEEGTVNGKGIYGLHTVAVRWDSFPWYGSLTDGHSTDISCLELVTPEPKHYSGHLLTLVFYREGTISIGYRFQIYYEDENRYEEVPLVMVGGPNDYWNSKESAEKMMNVALEKLNA